MNEYEYQVFIEELLHRVKQMGLCPSKIDLRKMIEDFIEKTMIKEMKIGEKS